MDRRRSQRFDLRVPIICHWKDNQASHEMGGFSRDISRGGVFVVGSVLPKEETSIDLEVLLPPLQATSQELRLQCTGVVVRVQREGETIGFAVACDFDRAYKITALLRVAS